MWLLKFKLAHPCFIWVISCIGIQNNFYRDGLISYKCGVGRPPIEPALFKISPS